MIRALRRARSFAATICLGVLFAGSFGACDDQEAKKAPTSVQAAPACDEDVTPHYAVVTNIAFSHVKDGPGGKGTTRVTEGVDLDGRTSDKTDDASCNQVDFDDAAGHHGIDNQFGILLPLIETAVGAEVLDGIIQGGINGGNLLLMLEIDHASSLVNDPCVTLKFTVGKGTPALGTDGVLLAGQTFDLDPTAPVGVGENSSIEKGELSSTPFVAVLPINLLGQKFTLNIQGAKLRFSIDEEGVIRGVLGGGILLSELTALVKQIQGASGEGLDLVETFLPIAATSADLAPDAEGLCQQLSVSMTFRAVPAFIFDTPATTP